MARNEITYSIRLDKWLWCARFYKTRSQAAAAIKGNKIRVNDLAVKASKIIRVDNVIQIRKTPFQYTVTVLKLPKSRLSASLAAHLYKEDKDSIQAREDLSTQIKAENASYPRTIGRPTKRNRREIIRFTRIVKEDD